MYGLRKLLVRFKDDQAVTSDMVGLIIVIVH